MRLVLEAGQGIELEPVLVAEIDGHMLVVDGHHRLDAYRRAQRDTIPARVMAMERAVAVMVSKLVNCAGRALEMHSEQKTDAAWQYLAAVTDRGATDLPGGESLRTVAGRFGIGRSTVQRMVKKLPQVNPRDWKGDALDSGTGFPRWRNARDAGADWQQDQKEMDVEQITQHEAEQLAKKIGALMERATPEAWARALHMVGIETALEASNQDARDFTAETAEVLEF
jgi:ParB-like chromosome segregation protein Spo0J